MRAIAPQSRRLSGRCLRLNSTGTERTFLEKYSDYKWGAILLLSGLGSAGAWLRSYVKRDEKSQSTGLRDRVLALAIQVRQENSEDDLVEMHREVDEIVRETLNSYDDGAIEEGDLSAFSLALEQFHRAVADKKPVMNSMVFDPARFRSRQ